jgi:hypothetical protein
LAINKIYRNTCASGVVVSDLTMVGVEQPKSDFIGKRVFDSIGRENPRVR